MALIRLQDKVPSVYTQESRDFQLLCRIYDCALNGLKYDIDSMKDITNTAYCRNNVLPLLQTKLGFFSNKKFNDKTLRFILEAFPLMVKGKGSLRAIQQAIYMFLKVYNIKSEVSVWYVTDEASSEFYGTELKDHTIVIGLNKMLPDLEVVEELFRYLMPTGFGFYFYFYNTIDKLTTLRDINKATLLYVSDNINSMLRSQIIWQTTAKIFNAAANVSVSVNTATYESVKGKDNLSLTYDNVSSKWYVTSDIYKTPVTIATYGLTITNAASLAGGEVINVYNNKDTINRLLSTVDTAELESYDSQVPTTNGTFEPGDTSKFLGIVTTEPATATTGDVILYRHLNQQGAEIYTPEIWSGSAWSELKFKGVKSTLPTTASANDIVGIYSDNTYHQYKSSAWSSVGWRGVYISLEDVVEPRVNDCVKILNFSYTKYFVYENTTETITRNYTGEAGQTIVVLPYIVQDVNTVVVTKNGTTLTRNFDYIVKEDFKIEFIRALAEGDAIVVTYTYGPWKERIYAGNHTKLANVYSPQEDYLVNINGIIYYIYNGSSWVENTKVVYNLIAQEVDE